MTLYRYFVRFFYFFMGNSILDPKIEHIFQKIFHSSWMLLNWRKILKKLKHAVWSSFYAAVLEYLICLWTPWVTALSKVFFLINIFSSFKENRDSLYKLISKSSSKWTKIKFCQFDACGLDSPWTFRNDTRQPHYLRRIFFMSIIIWAYRNL